MSSESSDLRPAPVQNNIGSHPPPKLVDPLPCPRCDSTNTKFCYYNNYNLSQPRHFCKACRRYWTHGGTLRNVPVGGGTRKNSKRSRSSSSSSSSTTTSTSSSSTNTSASALSTLTYESESLPVTITNPDVALPVLKIENSDNLNLNENENGNFISLLNSQMGMVGYGPGFGYGLCEFGVGVGGVRGNWAYQGMGYFNGSGGGTEGCNMWQASDGEGGGGGGGLVDGGGECFSWPGLAISTAGKGFK